MDAAVRRGKALGCILVHRMIGAGGKAGE